MSNNDKITLDLIPCLDELIGYYTYLHSIENENFEQIVSSLQRHNIRMLSKMKKIQELTKLLNDISNATTDETPMSENVKIYEFLKKKIEDGTIQNLLNSYIDIIGKSANKEMKILEDDIKFSKKRKNDDTNDDNNKKR